MWLVVVIVVLLLFGLSVPIHEKFRNSFISFGVLTDSFCSGRGFVALPPLLLPPTPPPTDDIIGCPPHPPLPRPIFCPLPKPGALARTFPPNGLTFCNSGGSRDRRAVPPGPVTGCIGLKCIWNCVVGVLDRVVMWSEFTEQGLPVRE